MNFKPDFLRFFENKGKYKDVYKRQVNDRALIERAYACGMDY